MSKNILLITRYFPPLDAIATHRMYAWAKYLTEAGYEVSVLTTDKKGQVVEPWNWDCSSFHLCELSYWDPICALGLEKKKLLGKPKKGAWWKGQLKAFYRQRMNERMPSRTDPWVFPACRELKRRKRRGASYDWVISSYGPPSAHIVGAYAKKLYGARWLADYRDLWIENHVFAGVWPFTLLEQVIERRCVGQADALSTVSSPLARVLQTKFPHLPTWVLENGFEPSLIDEAVKGEEESKQAGGLRIVYTGSIYRGKRDPSPLFRAIQSLERKGEVEKGAIQVEFYGSNQGDLLPLIEEAGAEAFAHDHGYVSQEEAYRIQHRAGALLFLESPRPDVDGILTGKLFEYLYSRTPILAVGVSDQTVPGQLIERLQGGRVCGEDLFLIERALKELLERKTPWEKDWERIGEYSRKKQVARLVERLEGGDHVE